MVVGDVDKVVVAVRFDPKVDMVVIAHRGGWTWLRVCQAAAGVSVQFPLWWASPRVRRRRRLRPAMRMCSHQSLAATPR